MHLRADVRHWVDSANSNKSVEDPHGVLLPYAGVVYERSPDMYRAEQGTATKGVELEFNGELAEGWQAFAGYAYSVSTDSDDKLTVGGGVNWQSKTGQDLRTYTQGSYALTNLMARYDITDHLSASLNVNNVFDRKYFSYVDAWGVYGAPHNLMTTVKYTF